METINGPAAQGWPTRHSEALRILRAARARIARGWTQGVSARSGDNDTHGTYPTNPAATQWCLTGALHAEANPECRCGELAPLLGFTHRRELIPWNDTAGRTQAEVLAAFDKAIALAEGNAPKAPQAPSASDSTAPDNEGDDP